jgi:hypothetical protein
MSKYFNSDAYTALNDVRKVEELLAELNRIYMTAHINEALDDNDITEVDIALRTISDYRSTLGA